MLDTYRSYGHEDIDSPCSHRHKLDIIGFDSGCGIYTVCVVVYLQTENLNMCFTFKRMVEYAIKLYDFVKISAKY